MSNRRFEMYHYRQILVRMRQGDSDRRLAKAGLIGRRKAAELRQLAQQQGWLDTSQPLPADHLLSPVLEAVREASGDSPSGSHSRVEPYREAVTAWWEQGIQATTIHQALKREYGFQGSYFAVRRFVNTLAATHPEVTVALDFAPGEAAQIDFGRGPDMVDVYTGKVIRSWFFIMTLAWSRHQYAECVPDQSTVTWLGCHRRAFEWFGGVPARLIIDNAKCAITHACYYDPEVQRAYGEYAEGYGFKIDACPPREPQKKGRVEAGVKFVKRSFTPTRTFRTLADANAQLQAWVLEVGNRQHGTTHEQPLRRFQEVEKPLLGHLPDVPPQLATWAQVKVYRDGHVRFAEGRYSVPFVLSGQTLWLKATETVVQLFNDHHLVAAHPRLSKPGEHATVEDHLPPQAQAYLQQTPQWCLQQAQAVGGACHALIERLLADPVVVQRRAAQGIIRLAQRYGNARLDAACQRALWFDDPRYRTVKTILAKGLDQLSGSEQVFDQLADSYTGAGKFCRDIGSLLNH